MYFKASLVEINRRLGPVLKELGLRMRLEGQEERHLYFQRTDENGLVWRSPLSFIFMDPERSGIPEATFANNSIVLGGGRSQMHAVGTNGWVHFVGGWSLNFHEIGRQDFKTWDDAFEHAAMVLLEDPLVPEGYGLPTILDDGQMFMFWGKLRDLAKERGIEDIEVGRIDQDREFYEFEYQGAQFRLVFDLDDKVQIIRNGIEVEEIDVRRRGGLWDAVASLLDGPDSDCDDMREP
ncbi:hypothetical protein [Pararhizobium sp. O133]|uniref:hypothetical protein n=1 Tax=Pararhizobium sp. O133 TaxID=3449278 RepID=UPI003F6835DB